MNGVHDMGGMQCFGELSPESDEPLFHEPWERDVLAISLAMGATGTWNLDQSRSARESLPPAYYLQAGYYRIWLAGLEKLLMENALVTAKELREGVLLEPGKALKRVLKADKVAPALLAGSPVDRPATSPARFCIGDSVRVRNAHTTSHTRMPGYIRGHAGVVHAVHGCHVFADSHARGLGEDPQWLYNVKFSAEELWGEARQQAACVHVDCWEPYLRDD